MVLIKLAQVDSNLSYVSISSSTSQINQGNFFLPFSLLENKIIYYNHYFLINFKNYLVMHFR